MHVLVVESNDSIGRIWCDHLERQGAVTVLARDEESAVNALRFQRFDVLVINLLTPNCSVLSISDLATYRSPNIAIIVVTAQDETDTPDTLPGVFQVARRSGLKTGEVVQWIQKVIDGEAAIV